MKLLLFDENLSPRLVDRLADIYPGSVHVSAVGLGSAFDKTVWEYARQNDFMIVTRDADFRFPSKNNLDTTGKLLNSRHRNPASK